MGKILKRKASESGGENVTAGVVFGKKHAGHWGLLIPDSRGVLGGYLKPFP